MKAIVTFGKTKIGDVIRIVFKDKSRIYLSARGLTFCIPYSKKKMLLAKKKKSIELTARPEELDILIQAINKFNYKGEHK